MSKTCNVWFQDLEKALEVFRQKCPEIQTFTSIEGNMYGDFIINTENHLYLITHDTFKVYRHRNAWDDKDWVRI